MSQRPCLVSLRVWGDHACFTRPELKAERVSYPLMTPSAARGILEAIYYEPQMAYLIHEIGVVARGRWFSFRRNEVAKIVKLPTIIRAMASQSRLESIQAGGGSDDCMQRGMLALADVAYRITAEIRLTERARPPRDSLEKYRDLFAYRAARGKCFHRPYLGCREFAADFAFVEDPGQVSLCARQWPEENLGMMLYDVFDPRLRTSGAALHPNPVYFRDAHIRDARLDCHPERVELIQRQGGID